MFKGDAQDELAAVSVTPGSLTEILDVVERTFESMTRLADDLLQQLLQRGSTGTAGAHPGVEGAA
jgi:hypothetical protein